MNFEFDSVGLAFELEQEMSADLSTDDTIAHVNNALAAISLEIPLRDHSLSFAEVVTNANVNAEGQSSSPFFVSWLWSGEDRELLDLDRLVMFHDIAIEFADISAKDFASDPNALVQSIVFSATFDSLGFRSTGNGALDNEILTSIVLNRLYVAARANHQSSIRDGT